TSERVAEMKKITPKIKNYLKDIFMLFLEFFEPIITRRLPLAEMEKIIKKRYYLVNRINDEKFNEEELKVISECKIMLDTINDFSETYIALNMNQYAEDIENETTNI
ncbi:MAG: hypothetical protein KJ574_04805, partial [Nanoarchaeota archaeon]|nr:hypothetical protein [Nanoarchaeota archaeon]